MLQAEKFSQKVRVNVSHIDAGHFQFYVPVGNSIKGLPLAKYTDMRVSTHYVYEYVDGNPKDGMQLLLDRVVTGLLEMIGLDPLNGYTIVDIDAGEWAIIFNPEIINW